MTPAITALVALTYGVMPLQPSYGAYTIRSPDAEQTSLALEEINANFNDASNKALLYMGAPNADPRVLRQMRHLYSDALKSVQKLDRQRRGPDYAEARKAVNAFIAYVDRHPPGVIIPPVVGSAD